MVLFFYFCTVLPAAHCEFLRKWVLLLTRNNSQNQQLINTIRDGKPELGNKIRWSIPWLCVRISSLCNFISRFSALYVTNDGGLCYNGQLQPQPKRPCPAVNTHCAHHHPKLTNQQINVNQFCDDMHVYIIVNDSSCWFAEIITIWLTFFVLNFKIIRRLSWRCSKTIFVEI